MATLKELYTTLKSLRDMHLPVDDKLQQAIDDLEEQIIKEEILPAISQNIEPQLSGIQRDLVLLVEYHPGEPLSVALSRKAKISEIVDAKPLTHDLSEPVPSIEKTEPADLLENKSDNIVEDNGHDDCCNDESTQQRKKNKSVGFTVKFEDGTIIRKNRATYTMIEALKHMGMERASKFVDKKFSGYPLISKVKRTGGRWQNEVDGWYVYVYMNNDEKKKCLEGVSKMLNIPLEIIDEENTPVTQDSTSDTQNEKKA